MKNILIVSQKEITENPVFKQDKNLNYIVDILSNGNKIDLLYLHKNINVSNSGNISNNEVEQNYNNIDRICIRDLMSKNMLQQNLRELIRNNKYEEIIFMSYSLAQFVMPYIEEELNSMIVIVDYRLSNLSYLLQQYKEESRKLYCNFQNIYKQFRLNFLQSILIFQKGDYFIFDKDNSDIHLLEEENIKNIISVDDIRSISVKKEKNKNNEGNKFFEIEINSDNFSAKMPIDVNKKSENSCIVYDSKYLNSIDVINEIINESNFEYFFIHKTKLSILPQVAQILSQYLSFNKKLCVVSPVSIYSRDNNTITQQQYSFYLQRKGNYSNWEKTAPLQLADCFMIKKSFLKKYGYFDNKYKTIDYALFDFVMRVYRTRGYYCTAKDVSVFKVSNSTKNLETFREDKQYLCNKWSENNFLF